MKTQREILKIKAVEQYIISQLGGTVDFMKLFKLLYFAQQKKLVTVGHPLMEDGFRAVKLGPIPSFTYKCFDYQLKNESMSPEMQDFVSGFHLYEKDGIRYVECVEEPNMKMLAQIDVDYINDILDKYGEMDAMRLSEESHKDQSWIEAFHRERGTKCKDIMSQEDIARAGGADNDVLVYIHENQLIKQAFAK